MGKVPILTLGRLTLPGPRFSDPNNLGRHSYYFNPFEENGIVYTCRVGHIVLALKICLIFSIRGGNFKSLRGLHGTEIIYGMAKCIIFSKRFTPLGIFWNTQRCNACEISFEILLVITST